MTSNYLDLPCRSEHEVMLARLSRDDQEMVWRLKALGATIQEVYEFIERCYDAMEG